MAYQLNLILHHGLKFTYRKYCRKCKTKLYCQEHYNCDNYRQTQQYKDSYKNTCLIKYGKESVNQVEEIKQKKIETNLNKTGYKWPLLNPKIKEQIEQTNLEKYGTKKVNFGSEYATLKSQETCLSKYGVPFPMQCKEIQDKCQRKYIYDSIYFDSSYELAYYIWLKDHNINFEYHTSILEYKIKNETHFYFPDFKVNGEYIEIKGSHLIDENMNLIHPKTKEILKEKTQCLKDNNVKIITDCSKYIEYIKTKYGVNYINSFKLD